MRGHRDTELPLFVGLSGDLTNVVNQYIDSRYNEPAFAKFLWQLLGECHRLASEEAEARLIKKEMEAEVDKSGLHLAAIIDYALEQGDVPDDSRRKVQEALDSLHQYQQQKGLCEAEAAE
jgi:hypothetical protein